MTAKWSESRVDERRAAKLLERMQIYKQFRDNGCTIQAFNECGEVLDSAHGELYWKVKLPGCMQVTVRDIASLRRLAAGGGL